jgi:predicted TIM-barrel fold metal-dependent hydrolase
MIIDAHYHLDEQLQAVDTLLAEMDASGVERTCLIAEIALSLKLTTTAETLAKLMTRMLAGKLRPVGLFFYRGTVTPNDTCMVLARQYSLCPIPDNTAVGRVLEAHPDRFYGWVFVNPRAADPIAELESRSGRPGWVGVKAHPFWHRYPVSALDETARWCQERHWPLLIHLGGDRETGDYRYLPARHNRVKILYAHAGVPFYREVWEFGAGSDNVMIDLSNAMYVNTALLSQAIKVMGPRRCIWGTDGPYGHINRRRRISRIQSLRLSEADQQRILGGNLLEIIRCEPSAQ